MNQKILVPDRGTFPQTAMVSFLFLFNPMNFIIVSVLTPICFVGLSTYLIQQTFAFLA